MGVPKYHNPLPVMNNNLNGELSFRHNRSMAGALPDKSLPDHGHLSSSRSQLP